MEKEFTPLCVVALSGLACVLGINFFGSIGTFILIPACICASAGIATLSVQTYRRAGGFLLWLGFGLAIGASLCIRIESRKKSVFTGIPAQSVSSLVGYASEDSRKTTGGGTVHRIRLVTVSSGFHTSQFPARGEAILFDNKDGHYNLGEIIEARVIIRRVSLPEKVYFEGSLISSQSRGYVGPGWELRSEVILALNRRIDLMGYPASALFRGLFLGNRDELPAEMIRGFTGTGTIHLLALSGLHVGIIYAILVFALRPVPGIVLKWGIGCLVVLSYLFLVGPRPSLVRATLMLIVAGLGFLLDRDFRPFNILAIVLIMALLVDPGSPFQPSFQLSFLAVAGALFGGRLFSVVGKTCLPRFIRIPLSSSLGAQIGTIPVVLGIFGTYYPIGVVTTLLLLPLVSAFIWSGVADLLLLSLAGAGLYEAGSRIMGILYDLIAAVNNFFLPVPGISQWFLPFYWSLLLGAVIVFNIYKLLIKRQRESVL